MGLQRTVFAFHPTAAIKAVDEQGIPPLMKRDSAVNSRMINLRTKIEQCDNIDRKKVPIKRRFRQAFLRQL